MACLPFLVTGYTTENPASNENSHLPFLLYYFGRSCFGISLTYLFCVCVFSWLLGNLFEGQQIYCQACWTVHFKITFFKCGHWVIWEEIELERWVVTGRNGECLLLRISCSQQRPPFKLGQSELSSGPHDSGALLWFSCPSIPNGQIILKNRMFFLKPYFVTLH